MARGMRGRGEKERRKEGRTERREESRAAPLGAWDPPQRPPAPLAPWDLTPYPTPGGSLRGFGGVSEDLRVLHLGRPWEAGWENCSRPMTSLKNPTPRCNHRYPALLPLLRPLRLPRCEIQGRCGTGPGAKLLPTLLHPFWGGFGVTEPLQQPPHVQPWGRSVAGSWGPAAARWNPPGCSRFAKTPPSGRRVSF